MSKSERRVNVQVAIVCFINTAHLGHAKFIKENYTLEQ
jgi:hypothetical protein